MKEKRALCINGWLILLLVIFYFLFLGYYFIVNSNAPDSTINPLPLSLIAFLLFSLLKGIYTNEPNESTVFMLFGAYVGTDKSTGLRWTNPFYSKVKMSLRITEYESEVIKVNDLNGNPIEISSTVTWRIEDTYLAYFEVNDYASFLMTQLEAALRELSMSYAYESDEPNEITLAANSKEISIELRSTIQSKLEESGIEIIDARINQLSYPKEIAHAMLQKQQAAAILSARKLIVEGAVGMVQTAISELEKQEVASFDNQARQKLASNLLIVLCSEQGTQPTINTDS